MQKMKKYLGLMMALLILLSSTSVFASSIEVTKDYPVNGPFTIKVTNHFNTTIGDSNLVGAKYELTKTHDMNEEGRLIKKDSPVKVGETLELTKGTDEITFTANEPGRYELVQIERPYGYFLGQGFEDEQKETPLNKVIVDFPLVADGKIAAKQELNVQPKFNKATKELSFIKHDDKGNPLDGIEFKLYQISLHENATETELARNGKLLESVKSKNGGQVDFTIQLEEGSYRLVEAMPTELVGKYSAKSYEIAVKAVEGKERTAAKDADIELTFDKDFEDGILTNYGAPQGGNKDDEDNPDFPGALFFKEVKKEGTEYGSIMKGGKEDTFTFKGTLIMPKDIKGYTKYEAVDMIDDRLDIVDGGISVLVNGVANSNVTFTKEGQEVKIKVVDPSLMNASDKITFEVAVKVNDKAQNGDKISNNILVIYNPGTKDENGDPVPDIQTDIPEDDRPVVEPFNGGATIKGIDGDEPTTPVVGAEFDIEFYDPKTKEWTKITPKNPVITDETGKISVPDLPEGKYRIKNTKAPGEYKVNNKPQEFEINQENPNPEIIVEFFKSKTFLPSTGTLGLVPFLSIGAASVLVGKKVMDKKED